MIEFGWPWIFLILPLPLLARLLLPPTDPSRGAALRVPFLREFPRAGDVGGFGSRDWLLWLAALVWILMV